MDGMEKAFELADKVDDAIDSVTDYAFDEKYGHLAIARRVNPIISKLLLYGH